MRSIEITLLSLQYNNIKIYGSSFMKNSFSFLDALCVHCSRSSRYLYLSYSEKKFFLLKKWNSLSAIITRGLINSHYTKSNYCHAKIFLYPFLCGTCCRKLPPVIFALASQFHAWWFQRFLTKGSLTFSPFYQCYSKLDFFCRMVTPFEHNGEPNTSMPTHLSRFEFEESTWNILCLAS